ncbi:ABC transporter ATP-binding protein [Candidatus Bathyarchaeota archaeon]|nr:ABC transporter ATP-binding protein [Candidatus Bathyarchaeota archaeon]
MSYVAELKNVSKTFDGIRALDDVTLKICEGEILALLGPNGSGKTTLLKILAFIEKPSNGELYFHNDKATEKNTEQMRMQSTMVFQKTTLFNATVYDNVAYGLKIRKLPKHEIDNRVTKAMRVVKLEGFERRHAKKLSGGEQQRVALARALSLNTNLLLLDEPTANLDPKNAAIVEEAITAASSESKTTIIIATHNMFQARNLPHRIALMANGKINEIGAPTEIFGKLSKTLASFAAIGNTFTGEATVTADGTTIIDIGNGVQVETATQGSGKVSVFVSPEDIVLSKNHLESSARNVLKGRIVEIIDADPLVKLRIDTGKPFMVQITKRSFNEMGLNLNTETYLTFKASNVQII